ncbi:MAG TPA: MlaD family protein, partial [Aquihabitans sp.]|nr:MlaD family protein [Aquihabitans sp.]
TGLYPGSPVRVLGIDVGRVTDVDNVDGRVRVRFRLDDGAKVPADASATIVPLTLLGERYIQLGPAYTGGEALGDGDRIPLERTTVPAEIDELLRGLQDFMGAIDPEQASSVVTNLAELLDGQGEGLNSLITNAAGTLDLLADEGDDLRAIVDSLGDLSATLRGRTDSIETLIRNYDLVAEVLIDNKGDLDATITELDRAASGLTELLARNQDPVRDSVEVLTATGRTLDANTDHLESTLASTVRLFAAAERAYDARTNSLALNNQLDPGITSDIIAGRFRDRIAGLCRRLGIELCSDPASPLMNDLVALLPGLLGDLANGSPLGSPTKDPNPAPGPAPTTTPAPTPPPPPSPPTRPTQDELLAALAAQLAGGIDPGRQDLLRDLDAERLAALLALDPALLQVLPDLSAEQLEMLRTVEPDDLGQTLLDLMNQLRPPSERLGPLLPPPGTAPATPPTGGPSTTLPGLGPILDGVLGGS